MKAEGLFGAANDFARHSVWLHTPMLDYASYGVVLFGLLLLVAWWVARRRADRTTMAASLWAPVATLLAVGVNQPLVHWFHEARPYTSLPNILVLARRSSDFSFPSDHAVMAGAVAAGVLMVDRRLGAVAWLAALVMGFARVYVAAHYPHDVVVGLLLGATVAVLGYLVLRRPLAGFVGLMTETPLRPLLVASTHPLVSEPTRDDGIR